MMENLSEFQKRLNILCDNLLPGLHRAQADLRRLQDEVEGELSAREIDFMNEIARAVDRQAQGEGEADEHSVETLHVRRETCRLRAIQTRLDDAARACNELFHTLAGLQ